MDSTAPWVLAPDFRPATFAEFITGLDQTFANTPVLFTTTSELYRGHWQEHVQRIYPRDETIFARLAKKYVESWECRSRRWPRRVDRSGPAGG
jgi:hypothetical protein